LEKVLIEMRMVVFISKWMKKAALEMWKDGWGIYNQDTEIRISKIYGLSWNERKGFLYVKCNFDYYVNEFCEEYKNESSKPNLKVIK